MGQCYRLADNPLWVIVSDCSFLLQSSQGFGAAIQAVVAWKTHTDKTKKVDRSQQRRVHEETEHTIIRQEEAAPAQGLKCPGGPGSADVTATTVAIGEG